MSIRVGTRGSALARVQTGKVCSMLASWGVETEIVVITTQGDTITGVPLHEIGGQGVFVRALDDAIEAQEIDCAVHSLKDVPALRPPDVITCAVLERDSPADFLAVDVTVNPQIIGSSSTRRRAQLLRHDPSLEVKQLRGNVDTRIRKLMAGEYDAIVLAEAGLQRLGLSLNGKRLPVEEFVPSPNQGTVAVVCRNDPSLIEILACALDHIETRQDIAVERAVMEELGGGCFVPEGVYCRNGHLIAEVLALDGSRYQRIEADVSDVREARVIGRKLKVQAADLIREAVRTLGLQE